MAFQKTKFHGHVLFRNSFIARGAKERKYRGEYVEVEDQQGAKQYYIILYGSHSFVQFTNFPIDFKNGIEQAAKETRDFINARIILTTEMRNGSFLDYIKRFQPQEFYTIAELETLYKERGQVYSLFANLNGLGFMRNTGKNGRAKPSLIEELHYDNVQGGDC